jgi:hypothetical protein
MTLHFTTTMTEMKAMLSKRKMGFCIDGHFWLEDKDGIIIEATPFENKMPFTSSHKYYKKATPFIQKMVIEMTHRKYEEYYGYSRNSDEWLYMLADHKFVPHACFHNTLAYLNQTKGNYKLVFGYLGVYHHTACHLPKNSVYWIYGCPRYTTVNEVFRTEHKRNIENEWTYEKWEERDNKSAVIGLVKKSKK